MAVKIIMNINYSGCLIKIVIMLGKIFGDLFFSNLFIHLLISFCFVLFILYSTCTFIRTWLPLTLIVSTITVIVLYTRTNVFEDLWAKIH